MDKRMLIFEYDEKKFIGILEYKEGKLIDLAGDLVYKFELLSPFNYQIEYFQDKPQSNMDKMVFSLIDFNLCKIVDEVIDKVIYYYINKDRLKEEYLIPYDRKAKIKEIRDFKFKKLSQEELEDKIESIENIEIPELEMYKEDFKYYLKEKVYFFETNDVNDISFTGEESGVLFFIRIGTRYYEAKIVSDLYNQIQAKLNPNCNVVLGYGIDRSINSKIKIELYISY